MSSANSSAATRRANHGQRTLTPSLLALLAKRGERTFQCGHAGGVTVGEPNRQPVDEPVHGARLIRYAWRLESCARDLPHSRAEPAGDACGS